MAKKLPAPENHLPELVEGAAQQFCDIQNSAADIEKNAILQAGIAIGAGKAFVTISDIGMSGALASYENIKKSMAWKLMRHPNDPTGRNFESIDEFCRVYYGKSYNRIQEITGNRNLLGGSYERAEELGLRQADYRVIKALPAPKQEIIKEALTEGASKEEVQRALRELAAADQKEIEALQEKLEDADARVLAEEGLHKSTKGQLATANKKLKRIETEDPDASLIELTKEAQGYATEALGMIRGRVRAALEALSEHHTQHGDDAVRVNMAGMLGQLQAELKTLRDQYNLPDVAEAAANPDAAAWAEIRAHLGGKTAADEGAAS